MSQQLDRFTRVLCSLPSAPTERGVSQPVQLNPLPRDPNLFCIQYVPLGVRTYIRRLLRPAIFRLPRDAVAVVVGASTESASEIGRLPVRLQRVCWTPAGPRSVGRSIMRRESIDETPDCKLWIYRIRTSVRALVELVAVPHPNPDASTDGHFNKKERPAANLSLRP